MTSLTARAVSLEGRIEPTDLAIEAGQLVAVIGPNGGGKTSLLRALARVEGAGGKASVNGEDVDQAPEARRRELLSFLPASRDLGWPIVARDVIALGLNRRDDSRIDALIDLFELEELADRAVDRLSTGERTRVLMARALASLPQLLLLDEPLSNLDPYWVLRFLEVMRDAAASGQTVLVAVHDLSHLHDFDRVLLVADGRLQMDHDPSSIIASERFGSIFRIATNAKGGWAVRPEDRQSSP